jgi:hypothetical protein
MSGTLTPDQSQVSRFFGATCDRNAERIGYSRRTAGCGEAIAQLVMLRNAGCSAVFEDIGGISLVIRPGLDEAIQAASGGVLVVAGFDRLAGRIEDLLEILRRVEAANAHLVSLHDGFDTREATSGFEFARLLSRFRQRSLHLSSRSRRARRFGPPTLSSADLVRALERYLTGDTGLPEAVAASGVSKATFLRRVAEVKSAREISNSGLNANPC